MTPIEPNPNVALNNARNLPRNNTNTLTPNAISRLFPLASKSLLAVNAQNTGPIAVVECGLGNAPLGKKEIQRRTNGCVLVRTTSVRVRLADEDGLCEKYFVDCCRYAGLIQDDSPDLCKIETLQRKAEKGEEEHTLIEIIQL